MVVRIQNGSVLLRDDNVTTSSGCCCGQCPEGETQCGPDCCTADEFCCGETCCDQFQSCCDGVCITPDETCCNGEPCGNVCCNGVCCAPGEVCIDGQCVNPCPPELQCGEDCCNPFQFCVDGECLDCQYGDCPECSFPEPRVDYLPDAGLCQQAIQSGAAFNGYRIQSYEVPIFVSWEWKAGFPDKLGGCTWSWVFDFVAVACVGIVNGTEFCGYKFYGRWRLFVIQCVDSNPQLVDITEEAILSESLLYESDETLEGFQTCEDFPGWLDDPEIVCDP